MPVPTRRAVGMLVAAVLLVMIGTNVQAGWLFVMASLIVGAVAAGVILPARMVGGISVDRRAPQEAFAGDDVAVELEVTNATGRARLSFEIADSHISPVAVEVPSLRGHETVTISTLRRAVRRGVVDGEPLQLSSGAPFGMARVRRRIPAPGRTVVYPRVVPIEWVPEAATATKPLDAANSRTRKGVGHDFLSIREYQQGDSLRHVHWASTARLGSLMVREFEQETPRRLGILLDTATDTPPVEVRRDLEGTGGPESALDLASSVAASLTMHALRDGHPVALAAAVEGRLDALPDVDEESALTWLAELRAPGGLAFADAFVPALGGLGRLDTLALVFPSWSTAHAGTFADLLACVDDTDTQVVAFVIDVGSFATSSRKTPILPERDVEDLLRTLTRADVPAYRLKAGEDLSTCLTRPYAA